jgi:glycosyltransferase involved in cell wall biosynthesis
MSNINLKLKAPWCVLYNDDAFYPKDGRLMGRHAAGSSYLRALAQKNFNEVGVLIRNTSEKANFVKLFKSFIGNNETIDLKVIPWTNHELTEDFGGIFLGDPQIGNYSILRSKFGHDKYSIVGITHTTFSSGTIDLLNQLFFKPVQEWDALICTSQCVKDTVDKVIENNKEFLKERYNINQFTFPQLPIIPLGVHPEDYNLPDKEKNTFRQEIGAQDEDVVLIFVGRLSFHAKAHYYPMYKSLEEIHKELGKQRNIHLVQVGWFANEFIKNSFEKDAKEICPNITCHFMNGLDQDLKNRALLGSDIFISLTDNFQETFGLTPLEGMAAGLPVIATDWNGYRDTVRHSKDGFLVPTTTLNKGSGEDFYYYYLSEIINYDQYLSFSSQTVSIDMDVCINYLRELITNKDLRIKLGESGKKRAKNKFSWEHIIDEYSKLEEELSLIRKSSKNVDKFNFLKAYEPYNLFSSYPTRKIKKNTNFCLTENKNIDKNSYIFQSDSINIAKDNNFLNVSKLELKIDFNDANLVVDVMKDNIKSFQEIKDETSISVSRLNRILSTMLKFHVVKIVEKK